VDPLAPVAPVGPVGPVAPVDPFAPVGPVGPAYPLDQNTDDPLDFKTYSLLPGPYAELPELVGAFNVVIYILLTKTSPINLLAPVTNKSFNCAILDFPSFCLKKLYYIKK
jgi:hypothetical protein